MSAAFDTLDHDILLVRLQTMYGIQGQVLLWLKSYLTDRSQSVIIGETSSKPKRLVQGVPQGSVLGPVLFTLYTKPMADIIRKHGLDYHFYADDSQIYVTFHPENSSTSFLHMEQCIEELDIWLTRNKLKLNGEKTEIILFSSKYLQRNIGQHISVHIGGSEVTSSNCIKNLGIYQDSVLSMENHINKTCQAGYYHLHKIGRIRSFLTMESTKSLVQALVLITHRRNC